MKTDFNSRGTLTEISTSLSSVKDKKRSDSRKSLLLMELRHKYLTLMKHPYFQLWKTIFY